MLYIYIIIYILCILNGLKKHPTSPTFIHSGDLGEGPQGEGVRAAQEELRPERQLRLRHHGTWPG